MQKFLVRSLFLILLLSAAESWALPRCPSSTSVLWTNCYGTMTFDGYKYVGEWKDDKRHGQGTYTFADGGKYVGEWRDNQQHGDGTFTVANGDKYVGKFKDGAPTGDGTYSSAKTNKPQGDLLDEMIAAFWEGSIAAVKIAGPILLYDAVMGSPGGGTLQGQGVQVTCSSGESRLYCGKY